MVFLSSDMRGHCIAVRVSNKTSVHERNPTTFGRGQPARKLREINSSLSVRKGSLKWSNLSYMQPGDLHMHVRRNI